MEVVVRQVVWLLVLSILTGCAQWGVKPWQRDLLAKEEMQLSYQGLDQTLDEHIYFSKEATSGGRSFAGGGCGCN